MTDADKEILRMTILLTLRAARHNGQSVEQLLQMVRARGYTGPGADDVREALTYLGDKQLVTKQEMPRAIGKALTVWRLTAAGEDALSEPSA
jgi:hypothetical protein